MAGAKLIPSKYPGIFRRGAKYVVVYRVGGRQRKETVATLDAARKLQALRRSASEPAELRRLDAPTLHDYALEWVAQHQGLRERTRREYRQSLERYPLRYFDRRQKITLRTGDVARFVAWLCDEREQGQRLSDKTLRNILAPLSACLEAARHEELIDVNPVHRYRLPKRPTIQHDDDEPVRALSRDQLAALIDLVHPRHRLLLRLLAATGLRISEAVALEWRHLALDGSRPCLKVRQGIVKGELGPPKSRHSRRDVPLPASLVHELRAHRARAVWTADDAPVFPASNGRPLNPDNLRNRVLKPAAEEADVGWAGFHALRHTFASLHIYRGTNVVQLSKLLGHHSPAFTLDRYAHLMPGEAGTALDLEAEIGGGGNTGATSARLDPGSPAPLYNAEEAAETAL